MSTALIDPLQDSRWQEFIARHPRASAFHTRNWLLALRNTYGHKPLAIVERSSTGNLQSAIVLCTVDSWITGRRLVSVPFADHCDPLIQNSADLESLLAALEETCRLKLPPSSVTVPLEVPLIETETPARDESLSVLFTLPLISCCDCDDNATTRSRIQNKRFLIKKCLSNDD